MATRKVRRFKKVYLSVSVAGKIYAPFSVATGCTTQVASIRSMINRGETVVVSPAGTDLLGYGLVNVDCGDFIEIWKQVRVPPVLVRNPRGAALDLQHTGKKYVGDPGMSEDALFGLLANGLL